MIGFVSSGFSRDDGSEDPERCEDAPPGSVSTPEACSVFVADGLGGYSRGYDHHTGGYWASRIAVREMQRFLDAVERRGESVVDFGMRLRNALHGGLAGEIGKLQVNPNLRGKLTQFHLASTLAGVSVRPGESNHVDVRLFWMGDSRVYWLGPAALHRLTRDDVKEETDAFTSLAHDAPMTKFLAANMPESWKMNAAELTLPAEGALIACTDGCFAYWNGPWEFECAMIDAFEGAGRWESWIDFVRARVDSVKKDDASLIVLPLEASYGECRDSVLLAGLERPCQMARSARPETYADRLRVWQDMYREPHERHLVVVPVDPPLQDDLGGKAVVDVRLGSSRHAADATHGTATEPLESEGHHAAGLEERRRG